MLERVALAKPSRTRVALSLACRPVFWPDFWRHTKLNIAQALMPPPMGQGRAAATAWAQERAVDEPEALARLNLPEIPTLNHVYPQLVARAAQVERDSLESLGGGGGIDLIFQVCEALRARTVVETGVAYGWSSLAILASICSRDGTLFSVDMPHPLLKDNGLTGAVVPEEMHENWRLYREPDCPGLRKILRSERDIDFVHYDSDKSYFGRAESYRLLWAHLRPGGILMSDDIADNTAFRDFAAEVCVPPLVVYSKGSGLSGARFVGLIRKR